METPYFFHKVLLEFDAKIPEHEISIISRLPPAPVYDNKDYDVEQSLDERWYTRSKATKENLLHYALFLDLKDNFDTYKGHFEAFKNKI